MAECGGYHYNCARHDDVNDGWAAAEIGESAQACLDCADDAGATLRISEEVNHDMCSRIKRDGLRVDLGRHLIVMHRMLNAGW